MYVVLIGRTSHHLAAHVDGRAIAEFAVVFGLIWLAWFNGTFWHELHGREDGRSRNYIFLQMGLLSLLAVFAETATGDDGKEFALTYGVLFALLTWQWWQVQRIDTDVRYRPTTLRYVGSMVVSTVVVLASAFADSDLRLALWAVIVIAWTIGGHVLVSTDHTEGFGEGVTASLVERIGLFTIIVLGEVVVGVVTGISDASERDLTTIATGMIGLTIGMGLWWNYFDMLGRRVPGQRGPRLANWLYAHLPLAMAISAGGAAMVSILTHAHDSRTPGPSAWLLTSSVAVSLTAICLACTALPTDEFPSGMQRWIAPTLTITGIVPIAVGALRPAPIVLVTVTSAVLLLAWLVLFSVYLAVGGDPEVRDFQLGHDTASSAHAPAARSGDR
ncbi:MAG: low temperature requirement protein A [Actinobacteria bacterium]|nr:low temperature requirement protein A [Actinomycetota bacterium]